MNKILSIVVLIASTLAAFFAGMLIRQPKINKLKKQVQTLQEKNIQLYEMREQQQRQINEMFIKYQAFKIGHHKEKLKCKENIKGQLIYQYASKEYLTILIVRVKNNKKIDRSALPFFNAFEQFIDGKDVSEKEAGIIKDYIVKKYGSEIEKLKECDYDYLIEEIKNIKIA